MFFMWYWTGLYSDEYKAVIEGGLDILMKTTVNLLGTRTKMKKGEPLSIEMEAQAAFDGVDKADDFKQMVARGGIDQMRDGGVHHRRMMAA
jgi:hypothetical protein